MQLEMQFHNLMREIIITEKLHDLNILADRCANLEQ